MSQILRHYLTKEGRFRKLFYCLIRIKEPCVRKIERLTRPKTLEILQTELRELHDLTPKLAEPERGLGRITPPPPNSFVFNPKSIQFGM